MAHKFSVLCVMLCCTSTYTFGQVRMSEIMYDPGGSDAGREWVELQNEGSATIDFTTWKFFEANVNHGISAIDGFTSNVAPGGFVVVVSDKDKFLADYPSYSGALVKSSFSLSNTGELLAFKNTQGEVVDQYTYSSALGAAGDGMSLQYINASWTTGMPTPGSLSISSPPVTPPVATTTVPVPPPSPIASTTVPDPDTPPPPQDIPSNTPVITGSGGGYVIPQLFGAILVPHTVLAGVEATFSAQAFTLGGKPVSQPRFAWNFGDGGAVGHGATTTRTYRYPGTYHIAVDVAATFNNNDTSVLEHGMVNVIAPQVSITESYDEEGSLYVALQNKTQYTIDVSGWIIRRGNSADEHYVLPKHTFISPFVTLRIPQSVTLFKSDGVLKKVELLFPNQKKVAEYDPLDGAIKSNPLPTSTVTSLVVQKSTPPPARIVKVASAAQVLPVTAVSDIVQPVSTTTASSAVYEDVSMQVTSVGLQENASYGLLWYVVPLGVLIALASFVALRKNQEPVPFEDYAVIEDEK